MITARIVVLVAALIAHLVPLILQAALRALMAALAVWAGLRLLRVSNVLVQKTTWGLVLIAALAMPLAPQWHVLPALTALRLPVIPLFSMPSSQATPQAIPAPVAAAIVNASPTPQQSESASAMPLAAGHAASSRLGAHANLAPIVTTSQFDSSEPSFAATSEPDTAHVAAETTSIPHAAEVPTRSAPIRLATIAWLFYLVVFAALLLRLVFGLTSAARLWLAAQPIAELPNSGFTAGLCLRASARVASPINIGSGIVLPADYATWDEQKLRVVLAHERSHIRQGDFYLQLLAGIYASLFWFSPLGWWLKRKLYELGEAISDRAGLEEAASRSSYAQLLLEFAALPRPTLTGVAMARNSHLTQRIERLLNESSFRQAFAAGGRRTLLAVLLVPIALFAATAAVRVEAAASATPQAQAAPQEQTTGQSTPEQVTEPAPAPAPDAAPMPPAPGAMQPPPPPPMGADDRGPRPMRPQPPSAGPEGAPAPPPAYVDMPPMPRIHVDVPPMPRIHVEIPRDQFRVHVDPEIRMEIASAHDEMRIGRDFNFYFSGPGDPYAVVGDPNSKLHIDGVWDGDRHNEIEKARKMAHGHFLWFHHDGKSYIVDDPTTVAQIEAMNKTMDDLREQMRALGEQMRAAGEKQRAEGQKMRDVSVPTPDLSKQMADLNAAVATLKAKQGGTINQKDLGDLQREIGRIQGDLGALQGKLIQQQMGLNGGMAKFGEQQGKLGGQMGELGGKMGKMAHENRDKINSIIDESLKNGKAKPVE